MARKKTEDQLLRKVFDEIYNEVEHLQHVDADDIKHNLDKVVRVNRRILGMSLIVVALAIFLITLVFGAQTLVDYTAWVNRPSFAERIAAPYSLESKFPPSLLAAVTVDAEVAELIKFNTSNIQEYNLNEEPKASQLLSKVIQLQSIVPAQIGDFTLQWNRTQSTILAQCLLLTGTNAESECSTTYLAEFVEPANFVDSKGNTVSLVMTKFANNEHSVATLNSIYQYARGIGRIGDFSLSDMLNVDYFYSITRKTTSFTWLNENWVLSVSANNASTIDAFMQAFPLYGNNPNLTNFPVVQISQNLTASLEVPTDGIVLSDAISGTE